MLLTIAVSARALFALEKENEIFNKDGAAAYDQHQMENEKKPLEPGVAFSLIKKLLSLNSSKGNRDRVEVVLLSRCSPAAGLRIMHSIDHYGLDIERGIYTQGTDRFRFVKALGAQLFLSANAEDVRLAISKGIAAAQMLPQSVVNPGSESEVCIAFDGDAVLFSDEAERINHGQGLEAFQNYERQNAEIPLPAGPFKGVLESLHKLQESYPDGTCPLRIALVTARGLPVQERVSRTLRSWGIDVHEAIFCGGMPKGPFLDALGADIFFDDTPKNCVSASQVVATGMVLNGVMHESEAAAA